MKISARLGICAVTLVTMLVLVPVACEACDMANESFRAAESVKLPEAQFILERDAIILRDIVYGQADGVDLMLDLYSPKEIREAAPLAVWIHGGGWVGGSKSQLGPGIEEMIRNGFIVAAIEYRFAPQFVWPSQIEDVKKALVFLTDNASRYRLDTGNVCLWGGSSGGQLAALVGLCGIDEGAPGWKVRAVVDICGLSDLTAPDFPEPMIQILETVFPSDQDRENLLRSASPVQHVSAGAPPFLIIHGEKDALVPPTQAYLLFEKLKDARVPCELVIVKNANHGFEPVGGPLGLTRPEIGHLTAEFFRKYLQGGIQGTEEPRK